MARGRSLRQSQSAEADERLLIEAAQRDPARFAELYDLYFDPIYTYVAWRAASRDEAEDIVSEVFHKALANLRHAKIRLGDTIVEMGEAHGQYRPMPTALHYYMPDVDAAISERSAPAPHRSAFL